MSTTSPTSAEAERRDALVDSIFKATTGALELMHVYLGDRLGLYATLAQTDAVTPAKWLHSAGSMRIVPHLMNRRPISVESKKKLWRPCREARALGL